MIRYEVVIEEFESAYKHLGQCAFGFLNEDISFWERAGMIDSISANVMRGINEAISVHGDGKFF